MAVFCGIDWAEDHHDIALVDQDGTLLAKRRIGDDAAGFAALLQLLAEAGDRPGRRRSRWRSRPAAACWWPACAPPAARCSRSTRWRCPATGTGTRSRGASPTPATRWCWPTSCAPTWPRTDRCPPTPNWPRPSRCSPAPSRTRSGQRTDAHNKLRSLLREYYPAILAAFASKRGGLLRPEARALLAAAPTPRAAARLTMAQLRALLRRAGLQRGIDAEADRLQQVLRADYLHHPAAGRGGLRAAGPGPAAPARHRLRQRRTTSPPPPPNTSTSTRTRRSSPACPASPSSPAPGSWPRSATTAPASPTPEASRPTPAAPR